MPRQSLGDSGPRIRTKQPGYPAFLVRHRSTHKIVSGRRMSCSGIKCRNTGSGYVKPDTNSAASRELDTRMADLLAAREAQDVKIWGTPTQVSLTHPVEEPKNSIVYTKR